MLEKLTKLFKYAGDALSNERVSEIEFASQFGAGVILDQICQLLLVRNGFFALDNALHVFPLGKTDLGYDLITWNASDTWRQDYGNLADGLMFFAEDAFGEQFAVKDDAIVRFNPETGESKYFASSIDDWLSALLSKPNVETGYPLAKQWQEQNRPLAGNERLIPKTLFVVGGKFQVDNLYALDAVKAMQFRAYIALQIKGLPDGTQIQLEVT
jgi:hypothetical protein